MRAKIDDQRVAQADIEKLYLKTFVGYDLMEKGGTFRFVKNI